MNQEEALDRIRNRKPEESLDLQWVDLSNANLTDANLTGIDLSKAVLYKADLPWANLSRVNLTEANLSNANLTGVDLTEANLSRVNLSGANLFLANLSKARLTGANLSRVNLTEADLTGIDLSGIDLTRVNLSETKTDDVFLQLSCIGSAKRMTTYNVTKDRIWCGCFTGTMQQWIDRINAKYPPDNIHHQEYMAAVTYFQTIAKARRGIT